MTHWKEIAKKFKEPFLSTLNIYIENNLNLFFHKKHMIMKSALSFLLVFSCLLISFNSFSQTKLEKKYARAIYYYETQQFSKLSALCDTLIKKDKKNPVPYYLKVNALDLNKDRPTRDEKLYKQIEELYSKSISLSLSNETHYASYFQRAYFYNLNFKYDEALEDYNTALALADNPKKAVAILLNRSGIYQSLFEDEKAMTDLKMILDYDENDIGAIINIGMIHLGNMNFEAAKKYFEHALELDPKYILALNNMGYVLSELEDYEGSIKYNNEVLKLLPTFDSAYNNRGFAKFKLGKIEEGIADIEKGIALNPTNSFAYRNLAEIYKTQKDYKKACEYVEKAKEHGFLKEYEGRIKSLNALCIRQ